MTAAAAASRETNVSKYGTLSPPMLTGKRPSMDVKETGYDSPKPLVPDIAPAVKAIIYEELSKSLTATEIRARSEGSAIVAMNEMKRSESKSKKISRKLKSLFGSDNPRAVIDGQQINKDRTCGHLPFLDADEEELYAFDSRSKSRWAVSGT